MLDILILLCVIVLLAWLIQFHWNRRSLYKKAAKFHGPPGWIGIGNSWDFLLDSSGFVEYLTYLTKTYPKVTRVWIGPQLIFGIYCPEAVEVILNSPKALTRKEAFYKSLVPLIGFGLVTASVPKWKRHRKIINPSFNQQVLNGFMETFSEQCTVLVDQLRKFADKGEFDILSFTSKCTVDLTCETIMGVTVDQQRSDSNLHYVIHRLSEIVAARMVSFWLHQLDFVYNLTKSGREFRYFIDQFHGFVSNVIREKRAIINSQPEDVTVEDPTKNKRKTFLDLLLKNSNFTEEELNEEVNTFMLGASDTVSLVAGFIFVMLGMHSDVQDKVLQEVLGLIGPHRQIELADLSQMKYTECVVKETLRIFPGFPYMARTVEDDIPFQDELIFPKGSTILISVLNLHRSEHYWPDPLKFNPDRFSPEETAKRHPYCFVPFSAGPRNCIGYRFSLMVLKTMVASVVRTYKISTSFKKIEDIELKFEVTLGSKHGYPVSLETRQY